MMRKPLCLVLLFAAALPWLSLANDGGVLDFTADELRRILQHGPWPQAWCARSEQPRVGQRDAIDFGDAALFREPAVGQRQARVRLVPRAGTRLERRPRARRGHETVDRNTPNLVNVRYHRWYGWDGAADSLWSQSIRPILNARNWRRSRSRWRQLVRRDAELACHYTRTFDRSPAAVKDDEALLVDVGKALAAFQETIDRGAHDVRRISRRARARRPRCRRALFRYLRSAGSRFSSARAAARPAIRGRVSPTASFTRRVCRSSPARAASIRAATRASGSCRAAGSTCSGPYNDDPARTTAVATQHVDLVQRNFGEFKVPSLRNAALTGPYMHNGQIGTLREVVRYYSEINVDRLHADGEQLLKPLKLTAQETDDLIVFVESLTDFRTNWKRSKGGEPTCK